MKTFRIVVALLFFPVIVVADGFSTRRLEAPSCGEILATWTSSQVRDILAAGIDRNFGEQAGSLNELALPLVQYGVQVRKVCAVCADFVQECANEYGGTVANSGLLMIPLQDPYL